MAKKPNKIKYTWLSNAPNTNSGYAVFTRDLLFRLLKRGYDFSCIGFFGVDGYHTWMHGEDLLDDRFKGTKLKVYPKMAEPYGGDALVEHSRHNGIQVAFTMLDLFSLAPQYLENLTKLGIKFIPYLPIDQEPVVPSILNNLRYAHKIITFSKFGQLALEKEGFASHMIYEGIDTSIFKPMDKNKMRSKFGIPQDGFVFGMVAANKENPPRKAFQQVLEAFKKFNDEHPNSYLFFHNQQQSPTMFPIADYARYLKVTDKIMFMNSYAATFASDSHVIAELINSFDVYLNPSMTEGFGMGMIESQACGVPPIGNRCHSMPELVKEGKTGFICETDKGFWRNLNGYVYPPNVDSLYQKMEEAYKAVKKSRKKIATAARKNVLDNYNIDTLVESQWMPFLSELEKELAEETNQ